MLLAGIAAAHAAKVTADDARAALRRRPSEKRLAALETTARAVVTRVDEAVRALDAFVAAAAAADRLNRISQGELAQSRAELLKVRVGYAELVPA